MNKESLTKQLCEQGDLEEENVELVQYGLYQGKLLLINTIIILLLGLLMGEMITSIYFFISFSILRSYVGGYHSSTVLRCYMLSTVLIAAGLYIIPRIDYQYNIYIVLISVIIMLLIAPVENEKKKLDSLEKKQFKKTFQKVLFVELVVFLIGLCVQYQTLVQSITITFSLTAILAVAGLVKTKRFSNGTALQLLK